MMERELTQTKGDIAHTTIKTLISMVPVVGAPAAEVFGMIITPPLEKRKEQWIRDVVDKLCELEEKFNDLSIESLQNNEQFITCVMNANAIALRTHSTEKLEALRNMVLNAAYGSSIDESMQIIYMTLINELSPLHIKVLDFLDNPEACFNKHSVAIPSYYSGSPMTLLQTVYADLSKEGAICNMIVRDLYNKGLVSSESINGMMTEQGMWASRTTDMGKRFIEYITSPL